MKKKQFISLIAFFSFLMTFLVGCGNQETAEGGEAISTANSTSSEKETVELTVWEVSRGADEFREEQEKAFLDEHPWIKLNKVVKEGDPGNEFYQAVASGTAPDFIEASFTMIDKFIAAGIVEPLNGYMDSWEEADQFNEVYLDMFTKDGNVYTLPNEISPMLFGYNKKLFEEAGIENPPTNWEEALEIAKKVNDPEKQIAGYATLTAEWTEWFFQYYVWQAGGDLTQENEDGTVELTFTDPAVIEAAKYYQTLASEKVLQSDRTLKFGDLLTQFSQDKIAMMPFATDWIRDMGNQGMDIEDIGLIIPPVGPSGEPVTAIGGSGFLINSKTDQAKKDAAWEYISWFMSNEQRSAYYENIASKGALAPIILGRTDMTASDFGDFPEEYDAVLDEANNIGRFEFYGKADLGSYVDRAVQKILANPNADPEKEFSEAQELAEKEVLESFNELNKEE